MREVVWSVNIMIAILIIGVALVLYYIFTYDKEFNSQIMADKDLNNFLKKIEQLNQIADLIKNNPSKKLSLSKCKNHDEVIKLPSISN